MIEDCEPATPAEAARLIAWLLYESAGQASVMCGAYIGGLAEGVLEIAEGFARGEASVRPWEFASDKDALTLATAILRVVDTELGRSKRLDVDDMLRAVDAAGFAFVRVKR